MANSTKKSLPQFSGPVVIPVDFSEVCKATLTAALAATPWPDVHLIHVTRSDVLDWEPGTAIADAGAPSGSSARWLADWTSSLGLKPSAAVVRQGDPGREIIEYAREVNADVIAIPSRGRGGIQALRLGSVAERVIRLADCSVLVLTA